jgi:hypothetical protein
MYIVSLSLDKWLLFLLLTLYFTSNCILKPVGTDQMHTA